MSQRWAAELSRFDFDVEYRSDKSNTVADSLSRLAEANKDEGEVKFWCRSKCPGMVKTVLQVQVVSNAAVDNAKLSWRKILASDENIQYVINNIVNNKKINYKKVEREITFKKKNSDQEVFIGQRWIIVPPCREPHCM